MTQATQWLRGPTLSNVLGASLGTLGLKSLPNDMALQGGGMSKPSIMNSSTDSVSATRTLA